MNQKGTLPTMRTYRKSVKEWSKMWDGDYQLDWEWMKKAHCIQWERESMRKRKYEVKWERESIYETVTVNENVKGRERKNGWEIEKVIFNQISENVKNRFRRRTPKSVLFSKFKIFGKFVWENTLVESVQVVNSHPDLEASYPGLFLVFFS